MSSVFLLLALSVIAHRGNSAGAPENTLAAFRQAIALEADYIELDVHLSKDGVPIVIHDTVLGRTTNHHSPHKISEAFLKEIRFMDAGSWFDIIFTREKVPTLEEVLDLSFGRTGLMIELKDDSDAFRLAHAVADLLEKKRPLFPVFIGSFSPEVLEKFRDRLPKFPIVAIADTYELLNAHEANQPDIYALSLELLQPELIRTIHSKRKKIWVWTIDSADQLTQIIDLQVDGVITNDPAGAMKQVL